MRAAALCLAGLAGAIVCGPSHALAAQATIDDGREWLRSYLEASDAPTLDELLAADAPSMTLDEARALGPSPDAAPEEIRARIARHEARIDELELAGDFAAALAEGEGLVEAQLAARGAGDWRVAAAREAVRELELAAGLSPEDRAELARAAAWTAEVERRAEASDFDGLLGKAIGALRIRHRLLGPSGATATALNWVGYILYCTGETDLAARAFRQALRVSRDLFGDEHPDVAMNLTCLAGCELVAARPDRAEPLYRRAAAAAARTGGDTDENLSGALNGWAVAADTAGDLDVAVELYGIAVRRIRAFHGEDSAQAALVEGNHAHLLTRQGDYARADRIYRKCIASLEASLPDGHPQLGETLRGLATNSIHAGNWPEAKRAYERALEILGGTFGNDHASTAICHFGLAQVAMVRGEHVAAEAGFRAALAIWERTAGPDSPNAAHARGELAGALREQGRLEEAEASYRRALAAQRAFFGPDSEEAASTLSNLATVAMERGDLETAERQLRGALDVFVRSGHPQSVRVVLNLADVLLAAGELDEGERYLHQALDAQERLRTNVAGGEYERALFGAELRHRWAASRLVELRIRRGEHAAAVDAYERGKARALLDLLQRPDARTASVSGGSPLDCAQVRRTLYPGELLLLYTWQEDAISLLVVPPAGEGDVRGHFLARSEEDAAHLRELVEAGGEVDLGAVIPDDEIGAVLAAERWIVVPDGPLNGLAFEASTLGGAVMLDGGPDVTLAHSGTVLAELRRRAPAPVEASAGGVSLLALADPDARAGPGARGRGADAEALPGSRAEARAIAELVEARGGAAEVLIGGGATAARLGESARGKRIVHLATHGFPGTEEEPLAAHLVLAPDAEGRRARLTLGELIERWGGELAGCELVVLSACDSRAGARAGDSVMALPWGFLHAGARSVVASRWRVDDTATALLMTRFYRNLLGERPSSKSEALREAKAWLRSRTHADVARLCSELGLDAPAAVRGGPRPERGDPLATELEPPYRDPRFWSAFVLVGDPE